MNFLSYFCISKPTDMTERIIILDSGSQVTQLIGRRLRELNVFCEIYPYNKIPALDASVKGVILSGSPCSVRDANAPQMDLSAIKGKLPLLGICYGAQYLAHKFGGRVEGSIAREYGRASVPTLPCCRASAPIPRSGCPTAIPFSPCRMAAR